MTLRALIHGSGFAGKGHAEALRYCGVEVVGMVSRTDAVVKQVAADLDIPYAGTSWQDAVDTLHPDIVAIGTPGGAHYQPILDALEAGCHVFCDKPLAATGKEARKLYDRAQAAGVKTAFTASYRYQSHALFARRLVAEGAIGEPWEAEFISHYNLSPLVPFGWSHRTELGGGRLNNNFTHKLSILSHILGAKLLKVRGEARSDMQSAPVVEGVHDFREREQFIPSDGKLNALEWRENNAEWSYTVEMQVQPEYETRQPVSALFRHSGLNPRFHNDYVAVYGSEAAIHINGAYAQGPLYLYRRGSDWQELSLPDDIKESLPDIEDNTQRNWNQQALEFVADIRGEGYSGYQTFYDGWLYQHIIDLIRAGDGWQSLPT